MKIEPPFEAHGWRLFAHPLFLDPLETLLAEVETLKKKAPTKYREKKATKLLAAILTLILEEIPRHPESPTFRLGNTLGKSHRHWRRVKFFSGRYRLFFQYSSRQKVIVLAWINDEETLRTYGSKTDAYAMFHRMLGRGSPPDDWETLSKEAERAATRTRRLISPSTPPRP